MLVLRVCCYPCVENWLLKAVYTPFVIQVCAKLTVQDTNVKIKISTVSSPKYAPFKQTPSPLFNPQVLTPCKRPVSSVFWECLVSFGLAPWSIEFVNTYTQNYCHLVSWPPLWFMLLALGTRAYRGGESPPIIQTMQVASVPLDLVSTLSAADFPLYMFSEAAVLSERRGSRRDCRIQDYEKGGKGCMHETNWIFQQTLPPQFCLRGVCKKRGHILGSYGNGSL